MLAARIHQFGGPEQIKLEDTDRPVPLKGNALIRVRAAGINPVDWMIREKQFNPPGTEKLPQTLGQDFAGEIEEVNGESEFKKGDRVLGEAWGAFAEYAVTPVKDLVRIPKQMSFETAAGIPMPALTAWQLIYRAARLSKGQKILIHGASGAVGMFAVQFAKLRGAFVIGTASRASFDHLQKIGIDEVVDYKHEHFEKLVRDVDVVIDSQGGDVQLRSFGVMRPGGLLINLIGEANEKAAQAAGVKAIDFAMEFDVDDLKEIVKLIENGKIRAEVAQVFSFDQTREAMTLNQEGKSHGKVVLRVV
jgi:NADPH:quinone reductase-like Zn-dependent oxidoreductase